MNIRKSRIARTLVAVLFGTLIATTGTAVAGTSGQNGGNNSLSGYGLSGYNTASAGQVRAQITGSNTGTCVALKSWNQGNPTVQAFWGPGVLGTMYGNSVYLVHSVDLVACNNVNVVYHRRIIPFGTANNYWAF